LEKFVPSDDVNSSDREFVVEFDEFKVEAK
jgi:hypothetical protein